MGVMANTLAAILQVQDVQGAPQALEDLVRQSYHAKVDRVILFHAGAVGDSTLSHCPAALSAIHRLAPLSYELLAPYPARNAASLAALYGGTISASARGKIAPPPHTLFAQLQAAGKRCALVAPRDSRLLTLFSAGDVELVTAVGDAAIAAKAVELIKQNNYDLIAVYQNQYDTLLHAGRPFGRRAVKAVDDHIAALDLLASAAQVYYTGNTLLGFCPDHGCHRTELGLGSHSRNLPQDLNVTHYFGFLSSLSPSR